MSWLDTETGKSGERKLVQAEGDAARFYRQVPAPALIGMEATGNCHWLVDLVAELGHELWVGDAITFNLEMVKLKCPVSRGCPSLCQEDPYETSACGSLPPTIALAEVSDKDDKDCLAYFTLGSMN